MLLRAQCNFQFARNSKKYFTRILIFTKFIILHYYLILLILTQLACLYDIPFWGDASHHSTSRGGIHCKLPSLWVRENLVFNFKQITSCFLSTLLPHLLPIITNYHSFPFYLFLLVKQIIKHMAEGNQCCVVRGGFLSAKEQGNGEQVGNALINWVVNSKSGGAKELTVGWIFLLLRFCLSNVVSTMSLFFSRI